VLRDRYGGSGSGNVRGMTGDWMVKSFLEAGVMCGFPTNLAAARLYVTKCDLGHKFTICDIIEGQTILFSPNPLLPFIIVPPSFLQTCLGRAFGNLRSLLRCTEMCISVR
jgi:hypothetical protein